MSGGSILVALRKPLLRNSIRAGGSTIRWLGSKHDPVSLRPYSFDPYTGEFYHKLLVIPEPAPQLALLNRGQGRVAR